MKQLFPGEPIEVHSNGKDVVLSGIVSSKYVVDKASDVAAGYVEKTENVVNLLRQAEGVASDQVHAARPVRRSEPQRDDRARRDLSRPTGFKNGRGSAARPRSSSRRRDFDQDGKTVVQRLPEPVPLQHEEQPSAVVKALQTKGLFQSLAEPNLIAENGKEASFLAGGEYPVPGRRRARRRHVASRSCSRSSASA